MANTNTNITASLHRNVAVPAQKLASVRNKMNHTNWETDEVTEAHKAMLQNEKIYTC